MSKKSCKELRLPEYGRNIQNMVDIALSLENREERNRCARSIISCMGNLLPHLRDSDEFNHKLWDHLAMMSDFKLDIDYPYEVARPEQFNSKPEQIPFGQSRIKERHYGRFVEEYINHIASDKELTEYKSKLILMIANYMKRCYLQWNQELIDDRTIFEDIYSISNGRIDVRNLNLWLVEPQAENRKRNRKQQRY